MTIIRSIGCKNKMDLANISVNKISAVIKQCRFFVLPLGLLAIISGYILTKNYSLVQLFWASLSFLFVHIFMASANNTGDVVSDRTSKIMSSQNPIVTNGLTLREARIMNFITPLLAITTSIFAGPYWTLGILIGIGLVVIYDVKPFRMKDKPSGILIPPLYIALPFLFAYVNTTSHTAFSLSVPLIFTFLFFNGITSVRHVPDFEKDLQMNVRNFTSSYSIEATRILELAVSIVLPIILTVAILLNYLSVLGLPLLILTTSFRLRVLIKSNNVLKNPQVWTRFAQFMVVNSSAIVFSIVGKVFG